MDELDDKLQELARGYHEPPAAPRDEMWARIHGQELMLLRLPDERRFSTIYRALQRALEQD